MMASETKEDVLHEDVARARSYYDSDDAEAFYSTVWGGENIHIGLYQDEAESIADASHRSVETLAKKLAPLHKASHVLDMGSGYGGTARYLARTFGCRVTGLNLSEVENQRARSLNEKHGLHDRVQIVQGMFEAVELPDAHFDAVCSQDSFLHSSDRAQVVAEAARLLKPGGVFVFTDIMQADDCDPKRLQPIFERIDLSSLGSPEFYRNAAELHGLEEVAFEDNTHHLITHYSRVLSETVAKEDVLRQRISNAYLDRMKRGLDLWVNAGRDRQLVWPLFTFRKPAEQAN
ncbi:methyltransferase type 11 [Salpingoeca rosetta]|uniref:Methyltransferase type 11 n=1 Tax=Salpingoeca rosetta (strain ATCC 50818 / BSB-021) TaxID=946362 RepID=F2TWM4_SALR5|nr:methyltransferase type 11 [Salpingoeca rosetta]EGD72470.1 methyltransferase type 11 [Salpingoeca rosetta]|eukprot:XP_004999039.1 methyltransferase type 11 [Salpingoeca rosetta]